MCTNINSDSKKVNMCTNINSDFNKVNMCDCKSFLAHTTKAGAIQVQYPDPSIDRTPGTPGSNN